VPPTAPPPEYAEGTAESLRLHYALDAALCPVRARLGGLAEPLTVVQLNLDTAVVRADGVSVVDGAELELTLMVGYAEFSGLAATALAFDQGDGALLGLRYKGLRRGDAERLLQLLHGLLERGEATGPRTPWRAAELVEGQRAIGKTCLALCAHRAEVTATTAAGGVWKGTAHRVVQPHPLPLRVAWDGPAPFPPLDIAIAGYNSLFRFRATAADLVERELRLALPTAIERVRHRQRRRVPAQSGMSCRFRHPLWPDREVVRGVRDVGTTGMALWSDADADLLYPGLRIGRVEISLQGAVVCSGPAVVCHVTRLPGSVAFDGLHDSICGLAFRSDHDGGDERWLRLVHRRLHPVARSGAFFKDFSWHVYETSGYFELSGKEAADFDALAPAYDISAKRLDAAPWLGIQAVWPSGRGVEATFTFVKVYSGTWFGFQLAKWPGGKDKRASTQRVLLGLYLRAFEHMQHDPAMRWVAGYLEAQVPWNEVAQFAWARGRDAQQEVCLLDFRLLEGDAADRGHDRSAIGPATGEELAVLHDHLARTRSKPWRDCLDLTRRRFPLDDTRLLWESAGMTRERRFFSARAGGAPGRGGDGGDRRGRRQPLFPARRRPPLRAGARWRAPLRGALGRSPRLVPAGAAAALLCVRRGRRPGAAARPRPDRPRPRQALGGLARPAAGLPRARAHAAGTPATALVVAATCGTMNHPESRDEAPPCRARRPSLVSPR